MEQKPTPMTEGEMTRVAEGLRTVADVQEKAIPLGFMSGKLGTAQRLRASVNLLRMGASAIEQLIGTQLDLGLVPIRIRVASHASATAHVHPIVAAEIARLRKTEDDHPEDIDAALAQQKLDDQP